MDRRSYSLIIIPEGYRKKEVQAKVEEHLKGLILKHFDPKKADLIFTEEGSVRMCVCVCDLCEYISICIYTRVCVCVVWCV